MVRLEDHQVGAGPERVGRQLIGSTASDVRASSPWVSPLKTWSQGHVSSKPRTTPRLAVGVEEPDLGPAGAEGDAENG